MKVEVKRDRDVSLSRRQAIMDLQSAIAALPTEGAPVVQVSSEACPVRHHFAPGSYAREMFLPKGLVVVGKIHKHAHVNVISQGHVRVFTEQEGTLELRAPLTFISSPGTKRVVEVLEDTVWTTVHATESTDPDEIEREVIAADYTEIDT